MLLKNQLLLCIYFIHAYHLFFLLYYSIITIEYIEYITFRIKLFDIIFLLF